MAKFRRPSDFPSDKGTVQLEYPPWIGHEVWWESGSQGRTKTRKDGIVVAIIQARTCPYGSGVIKTLLRTGMIDKRINQRFRIRKSGFPGRPAISYLVSVGHWLYWPCAKQLRYPEIQEVQMIANRTSAIKKRHRIFFAPDR